MRTGLILGFCFFILGLLSVGDYGITWDEPENFYIGRVYLNVLLTGNTRILGAPEQLPIPPPIPFRAETHLERYPPFAATVASLISYVFAERLELMEAISAHHLAVVLFGALAIVAVYGLAYELTATRIVAVISALILAFYPVFYGQAHNNIKDVPQAALFSASLYALVLAVKYRKARYLVGGGVIWGLALATKFNAIFILPIVLAWMVVIYPGRLLSPKIIKVLVPTMCILCYAVLALALAWPWLATDPLTNLALVYRYINEVGRGLMVLFGGRLYQAGLNVPWYYAPVSLSIVTPLLALAAALAGMVVSLAAIFSASTKRRMWSLPVIWLIITLGRYLEPSVTVYNGIRQFMEVVPAVALLGGMGIWWLSGVIARKLRFARPNLIALAVGGAVILQELIIVVRLHPYQALYFNELAGGMAKASRAYDFDYWGFSVKELVDYLNRHEADSSKKVNVHWLKFRGEYFPGNRLPFVTSDEESYDYIIIPHSLNFFAGAVDYWYRWGKLVYAVKREGATIGYLFATKP